MPSSPFSHRSNSPVREWMSTVQYRMHICASVFVCLRARVCAPPPLLRSLPVSTSVLFPFRHWLMTRAPQRCGQVGYCTWVICCHVTLRCGRRVFSLAVAVLPLPPPFFSRLHFVGPASSCMKRNQLFLLYHLCRCPKSSPIRPGADRRIRPGLLLCSELACFLTPGAGPNASAMS